MVNFLTVNNLAVCLYLGFSQFYKVRTCAEFKKMRCEKVFFRTDYYFV
ncbi:hypothetical protein B4090_1634 [Bacillus licheniformis]|nr:hypothetical protein B4090_1634 [Bacillus licheniformis]